VIKVVIAFDVEPVGNARLKLRWDFVGFLLLPSRFGIMRHFVSVSWQLECSYSESKWFHILARLV
jgi:hypothetical protein